MTKKNLSTKRPSTTRNYIIPQKVLGKTERFLRQLGLEEKEAIAYWIGGYIKSTAVVTNVVFPNDYASQGTTSLYSYASVDLKTAFAVAEELHKRKELLLTQIHTHPFEAFHSSTDSNYPITHRIGFVSIVIPFFARLTLRRQETWAVFEYLGKGRWRTLEGAEIKERFVINGRAQK